MIAPQTGSAGTGVGGVVTAGGELATERVQFPGALEPVFANGSLNAPDVTEQ